MVIMPYHGIPYMRYIEFYSILILYINLLSEKSPVAECQEKYFGNMHLASFLFFPASKNKINLKQSARHLPLSHHGVMLG
jgi:hypothetical protein